MPFRSAIWDPLAMFYGRKSKGHSHLVAGYHYNLTRKTGLLEQRGKGSVVAARRVKSRNPCSSTPSEASLSYCRRPETRMELPKIHME